MSELSADEVTAQRDERGELVRSDSDLPSLTELLGADDPQLALPVWKRRYSHAVTTDGSAMGVQKVAYSHDRMIDYMIADPTITQLALARHFGYTPSWVCKVMTSDAFQSRLAERTEKIIDPSLLLNMRQNFEAMVQRSMAILQEKLDQPTKLIPDNLALRTLELSAKALGLGARPEAAHTEVNVEIRLETLGDNLTRLLQRRKAQTIDVTPPAAGRFQAEATLPPPLQGAL